MNSFSPLVTALLMDLPCWRARAIFAQTPTRPRRRIRAELQARTPRKHPQGYPQPRRPIRFHQAGRNTTRQDREAQH